MPQLGHKGTTSSGMSNMPEALSYPRILPLSEIPEIKGQFVYVIRAYPEEGLTIVINRDIPKGDVYMSISDFDGNSIDLRDEKHPLYKPALEFAQQDSSRFVAMMKTANIQKILLYISVDKNQPKLVDLRASLDKFYGPGMIRDLFSKIYPTQEVIKTVALDDNTLKAIENGEGSYKGPLILKCSKFKTVVREKELLPLYAKIR